MLAPIANITTSTGGSSAVVTFAPSATDNVSAPANIVVSCQPPSVTCFRWDHVGELQPPMKRATSRRPATFTVTVNRLPPAAPDAASTLEATAVTIPVLANDTDSDGDTLTLASVGTPAHGTTAIDGVGVVYTPAAAFFGIDTFQYGVSDGHGGSAIGTVTVSVSRLGRFVALSRD